MASSLSKRLLPFVFLLSVACGSDSKSDDAKGSETNTLYGLWASPDENGLWIRFTEPNTFTAGRYDRIEMEGTWELKNDSLYLSTVKDNVTVKSIFGRDSLRMWFDDRINLFVRTDEVPKRENQDIEEEVTEEVIDDGKIKRGYDLAERLQRALVPGDTLSFDGVIEGTIKLKNLENITLLGHNNTFFYSQERNDILFELHNCRNITIDGFTATHMPSDPHCEEGVIFLSGCSDIKITNNDLSGCGTYAVSMDKSSNILIADNVIHDCSANGIFAMKPDNSIRISNNVFYHNGYGADNHIDLGGDIPLSDKTLKKNKVISLSTEKYYCYDKQGLPVMDDNGNQITTVPYGAIVSRVPEGLGEEMIETHGVKALRRKITYKDKTGWVCDAFVIRFPLPQKTYDSFRNYLADHGHLRNEKRISGHQDGEAYADIWTASYKEGIHVTENQGWEWGTTYYRIYDMTPPQFFVLSRTFLDGFGDAKYPYKEGRVGIDSTEFDYGMQRVYMNCYLGNQKILSWFNIEVSSPVMGQEYEVTAYGSNDVLLREFHGS